MHFVFLTLGYHPDLIGGAYRYVTEIAERLAQRGHRVDAIYPSIPPSSPQRREAASRTPLHGASWRVESETRRGVHLWRFPNAKGFFFANWLRENAAARRCLLAARGLGGGSCLIVLAHPYWTPCIGNASQHALCLFTGPWAEEYQLSHTRPNLGWRVPVYWILKAIQNRLLRRVKRILTISQYYAEQLPAWHGTRLAPVEVISGGVNTDFFRPVNDRAAARAELGLGADDFLFVTVRRLEPRMGLSLLLQSFGPLTAEFCQARLWLAGSGSLSNALSVQLANNGWAQKIRLLGHVADPDLPRLLSAADCSIVPSLDLEGFGLATLESLACGTPVIGSRSGATPELLERLDPGLLFDSGSIQALAAKLSSILQSPQRLPSRTRCREYALRLFPWDGPVRRMEAAYEQLCGTGGTE